MHSHFHYPDLCAVNDLVYVYFPSLAIHFYVHAIGVPQSHPSCTLKFPF